MPRLLIKYRYPILFCLFVIVFWFFLNSVSPVHTGAKIIFFIILFYLFLSFTLVIFRWLKYNLLLSFLLLSIVLLQAIGTLSFLNFGLLLLLFFFIYLGIK